MGMEGLDSWLDLIRWMSGSIVSPTAGDVVVLATICYSSWDPVSHYIISSLSSRLPLLVSPSGLALVCNAPIPRVQRCYCNVYTPVGNTLMYIC